MKMKKNSKIISHPETLGGKPLIPGTRISVEFILELLSSEWTYEEIMKDYKLKKGDILAAIDYAKETVREVQAVSFSFCGLRRNL